jgi:hypothetical protein
MFVMWTAEDPANPLGEFVGSQQTFGLYNLTLAVNPFGLDRVQPRTLLWQKAAYDPHSISAVFDLAVVRTEPAPDLFGDMPARVVPDQKQNLLAKSSKLLATPLKELGRHCTDRPAIHEAQPRLPVKLRQVESVAGDGFRIRVVLRATDCCWRRRIGFPSSAQLLKVGKANRLHQHSSSKPTAHSGSVAATSISRSRRLFFFRIGDRGR